MSINSDFYYQQITNQRRTELTARATQERLAREFTQDSSRHWWRRLMGLNWRAVAPTETAKAEQRRNHPSVRLRHRHMAP